ncbi:MAG: hypothetical protein ACRENP_14335 [Longimicrobiales bacterium]
MSAGSPDPETLAAFVDGTLAASERDRVSRALASSPELYETVVEAVAVRNELLAERVLPISVRIRSRMLRPAVALPIAAALAGLLMVGRVLQSPSSPYALQLVEDAAWITQMQQQGAHPTLGREWSRIVWPASRSATASGLPVNAAFGAGVLLVNLEVAAAIRDGAGETTARSELSRILGDVPLGSRAASLAATATTERARRDLARSIEQLFAGSPWYALGIWLGQARLAAAAGDPAFFAPDAPATKALNDVRDRLAADPTIRADANTEATLNQVNALLDQMKAGRLSGATASASLASILAVAAASR